MILHAVYFAPIEGVDTAERDSIMGGLAELVGVLDGFLSFQHGENIDLERKSPEAAYGFHAIFADKAALQRYAADPRHLALGARLVSLCGGGERIKVYDLQIPDP